MQHLLLDLYGCDVQRLADADGLRRFLNELPDHLGMSKAGPADLYYIDAVSDPNDAGHSGLVLASQHISLHAWPPFEMINIDIFSRTGFDEAQAIAYARAAFVPNDIEVRSVQRAVRSLPQREDAESRVAPGDESKAVSSSAVVYRCQWPGGCTISTFSAAVKYCEVHRHLLLPP